MYHKIEMHISKFNNYLIFCEHFLEPNFFKGIHLAKPKKNELKSIFNYLQNIRYDMTNKDHFTNLPQKIKEILIKVLLNCILPKSVSEYNEYQKMLHNTLENIESSCQDENTYITIANFLKEFHENFLPYYKYKNVKLMSYKIVGENILILLYGLPN